MPQYGIDLFAWWIEPEKVAAVAGSRDRN
jgi:hypothetical protein